MIDLRDLECLVALARCRHFARAAEECGLSQPAFSMRIQHLEKGLGPLVVRRANRFQALSPEGETVVARARGILEEMGALEQEIRKGPSEISGSVTLGVVPTAVAEAAQAASRLNAKYPDIHARIISASSLKIQQGLEEGRFDAGLTYSDGVARDMMRVDAIYDETYVLIVPEALWSGGDGPVTWAEAATYPMMLLEPGMQNRRIIDQAFETACAEPNVALRRRACRRFCSTPWAAQRASSHGP